MTVIPIDRPVAAPGAKGRPLRLVCRNHQLISGNPHGDEVEAMRRWFADAVVMAPMGRPARDWSRAEISGYIDRFDRRLAHLFIIRDLVGKPKGTAIINLDPVNKVAFLDISIGARLERADTQTILAEGAQACASWIFDDLDMAKIAVQVSAANVRTRAWLNERMTHEGVLRGEIARADGRRGDLHRYGLLREEWPALLAWIDEGIAVGRPQTAGRFRPEPPWRSPATT